MKLTILTTLVMTSAVLIVLAFASAQPAGRQGRPTGLPPGLSDYITRHVKPSPDKQAQLLKGQPVTQLLEADPRFDALIRRMRLN